ncbi:MAG: ABC transporter ATP-binding protein, partial [Chloroflexi bacterium]|nr:ABC transporter ATP-binding protein [Chloroflexota bacterium]
GMAEVRELIRSLGRGKRTVVLASHLLHEVEQVCDTVAILSRGRLIAQGKVRELLQQRGGVRLRTTEDSKALPILASLPWLSEVRMEDGYIVAAAPPERSGDITRELAERGVFVTELAPVHVSLERYFLEVTGSDEPQNSK